MMRDSEVTIQEAYARDVGRGVARINKASMDLLSLAVGDVIEISGKYKTVAKCLGMYPAEENKKIIRIDGLIRNNCKAKIGSIVSIRKIKFTDAEAVAVVPMETMPPVDPRYLADALNDMPVIPEQFVLVPYFGGRLTFMIVNIMPETTDDVKAAMVTQKTRFEILEKRPFSGRVEKDVEDRRRHLMQKIWSIEKLSKSEFDDLVNNLTEFYTLLSNQNKKNED